MLAQEKQLEKGKQLKLGQSIEIEPLYRTCCTLPQEVATDEVREADRSRASGPPVPGEGMEPKQRGRRRSPRVSSCHLTMEETRGAGPGRGNAVRNEWSPIRGQYA